MDVIERAKGVMASPIAEWRAIEPESGDAGYLFTHYVAFLAAIPPIAHFVRDGVLGWTGGPHLHHLRHGGFFASLFSGAIHYLMTFVALYGMAAVIDGLAPTFSSPKNPAGAMKLAVYAMTPVWLAGVFALIPGLGLLRLLALAYAIYLFWLGLPTLMKTPPERAVPYTAATVVCAIILSIVFSAFVGPIV